MLSIWPSGNLVVLFKGCKTRLYVIVKLYNPGLKVNLVTKSDEIKSHQKYFV